MNTRLLILSTGLPLAFGAFLARPVAQDPATGSIVGTIAASSVSSLPALEVTKNQDYCGDELPSEALVANSTRRIRYAVVYLEGADQVGDSNPATLEIRNENCAFVPHVQAGLVKSTLEVTSADPILHNTHLFLVGGSRRKSLLNLALPGEGVHLDASRATRRPGVIELKCDAHKWMSGYLLLFTHPYYAVTDSNGTFTIRDVPPGTHKLKVWHETLGELEEEVVVESGKVTSLSLALSG